MKEVDKKDAPAVSGGYRNPGCTNPPGFPDDIIPQTDPPDPGTGNPDPCLE